MSRKGLVKASVEREYPKIKKCLEEDIYFNIWVDASRKITVLPVGRPNNEKERNFIRSIIYCLVQNILPMLQRK